MPRPTKQDAALLLDILSVYNSSSMIEARKFFSSLPIGSGFDETMEKYPKGSEGRELFGSMMAFWDTLGLLLKKGLLNKDLVFDTFLEDPPWPKVKRFFEEARKKANSPREGENIEVAYNLSVKWKTAREKKT